MFTVLGADGFLGRVVVRHLRAAGHNVLAAGRDQGIPFHRPLGTAIYCIGLTSDFRVRPLDSARAHVSVLVDCLENAEFDSLLYLSSTRIYAGAGRGDEF